MPYSCECGPGVEECGGWNFASTNTVKEMAKEENNQRIETCQSILAGLNEGRVIDKIKDEIDIKSAVAKLIAKDDAFNVINYVERNNTQDVFMSFECNTKEYHGEWDILVNMDNNFKLTFHLSDTSKSYDIHIYLKSIRDYKVLLFDLSYFIRAASAWAQQTIITESGYSIREYYADPDKTVTVMEISNNQLNISKTTKLYIYTDDLEDMLNEAFNSYGDYHVMVNFLEYGPYYDESTGEFKKDIL